METCRLETLVRAAGFHVDRAEYVDSLGFLATLVFKWFGNREGNVNQQGLILPRLDNIGVHSAIGKTGCNRIGRKVEELTDCLDPK